MKLLGRFFSETLLVRVSFLFLYYCEATHFISLNDATGVTKIVLYNMVGGRVREFSEITSDARYSLENLPRGMYLVQIIGTNNVNLAVKRLYKQ